MSTQSEDRRRFRNRRLTQLQDIVHPFESRPSSHHLGDAMGAIQRLRDEGHQFWEADSNEFARWHRACTDLWEFLNTLGRRRDSDKQPVETAFREFVQAFEHSIYRMKELLHGRGEDLERDLPEVDVVFRWVELVYRLSTYGLVSYWIDDKTEEGTIRMTLNMTPGEWSRETEVVRKMRIPRKYRNSARLRR